MKANITFPNVKAYAVERFDVRLGEAFGIELEDAPSVRWFADNDAVLSFSVEEGGGKAVVKATAKGTCEIQLQGEDRQVLLVLSAEVFDTVATGLRISAGPAELK
jgi:hypothetical protein